MTSQPPHNLPVVDDDTLSAIPTPRFGDDTDVARAMNLLRNDLARRGVDVGRISDTELRSMVEHMVSFVRLLAASDEP